MAQRASRRARISALPAQERALALPATCVPPPWRTCAHAALLRAPSAAANCCARSPRSAAQAPAADKDVDETKFDAFMGNDAGALHKCLPCANACTATRAMHA